jgi:hypothetical protein
MTGRGLAVIVKLLFFKLKMYVTNSETDFRRSPKKPAHDGTLKKSYFLHLGLCNSKRIDKLLAKFYKSQSKNVLTKKSVCGMCKEESKKLSTQIYEADKDLVLDKILEFCGYASSYSDACRAIVMDDFDEIYQ